MADILPGMGAGFIRRFTPPFPSNSTLSQIEGVDILDRAEPAQVQGATTGIVCLVGEFEDGPYNSPYQASASDIGSSGNTFGGFGYTYPGGLPGSNPCAQVRYADSAVIPEYWNGNGWIATTQKTFSSLVLVRVNTSVGAVQFTANAYLLGVNDYSIPIQTGQHIDVTLSSGGSPTTTTATFTGVAATLTSAAGTYPSTFAGGENITFGIDGTSYTAYFLSSDQSHAQVIARMNLACGFTAFAVASPSTETSITGLIQGTAGSVQITAVSSVLVTTATGFSVGGSPTAGTGNVPNLAQVTPAQANTVVAAAVTGAGIDRDVNGYWRITNTANPGVGTVAIAATSTVTTMGFPTGVTANAIPSSTTSATIPAGTVVANSGGTKWVTTQTITVIAGNAGPYSVPIRPALDNGSVGAATVGTITTVSQQIASGSWSVVNPLPVNASLTEAQIDAAYVTAINATINLNSIAKKITRIVSARQSNLIRQRLRSNAQQASMNGCYGRTAQISPPLGTTRAVAESLTSAPGVGVTADERVDYCYPGWTIVVPSIAAVGTAGGPGFNATGQIDTHSDTRLASVISQINPEENPGQVTNFLSNVIGVELNNADVQNLTIQDYINFKAAGICAPRIDEGDSIYQSAVTSVNPQTYPNMVTINRRQFADYCEDSIAPLCNGYIKKMGSVAARGLVVSALAAFFEGLKSSTNPSDARIADYLLNGKVLNTDVSLAAGLFKIKILCQMNPTMLNIVLDCTIGETVTINPSATAPAPT